MARRVEREEGENHERWLVSYADFITLLFAFFTVMYALSSVNESKYAIMSEAMEVAFTPSTMEARMTGDTPKDLVSIAFKKRFSSDYRKVHSSLIKFEKEGKVSLIIEERGVVVTIHEKGFFQPGSADILPEATPMLDEIGRILKVMPNQLRIEGHTDNAPLTAGKFSSNWDLSSARALHLLKYITHNYELNPGKLSATGYGEFRPFASNNTPEGRAKNRRVDIVLLNKEGSLMEPDIGKHL
ncbi:MAG: OmpA family protein [Deltaproteobacteria bacterium]|nr:OmpA family protein [Deltaproteobacteria bacterium]